MTNVSRFAAIFLTVLTSAVAVSPALASHGQGSNSGSNSASNSGSSSSASNGSRGSQSNSNSGPGYPFLAR